MIPFHRSAAKFILRTILFAGLLLPGCFSARAQEEAGVDENSKKSAPSVYQLTIALPLQGGEAEQITKAVAEIVSEEADQRPVLLLAFQSVRRPGVTNFEHALALARYLSGDHLRQARTVAYLPQDVTGHAVLPVLACEEIIAAPEANLGRAGEDEEFVDATIRRVYTDISEKRRTIPAAAVLGMLDAALAVYEVETPQGSKYVLEKEFEKLQAEGNVTSAKTVIAAGQLGEFSGQQLRHLGFASHLAADRKELAAALNVLPQDLVEIPLGSGNQVAVRIDVEGLTNSAKANWIVRSLNDRLQQGDVNLVCVVIDSAGGSLIDSMTLANYLNQLDPATIRTVAYIPRSARGDAILPALACQQIIAAPDAVLGGPGDYAFSDSDREELAIALKSLTEAHGHEWSLAAALLNPREELHRWENKTSGQSRYVTPLQQKEFTEAQQWRQMERVTTEAGLTGTQAETMRLVRETAENFSAFKKIMRLEQDPQVIRPNWAHNLIEWLASPPVTGTLLFIACFALLLEFMQPGIGVAGFASGVCFLLFFWSQFFHGTAEVLEILLFAAGVIFVLVEIFALPGMGIFGIGGVLMMIFSIVLATQTFVIPVNNYQFDRVPTSLFMVLAAAGGAVACLAFARKFLPNAPLFNRMMLQPPEGEELAEISRRESLVSWNHLLHKKGVTTTPCYPSGKARFGDETIAVTSEGEIIPAGTDVTVIEVQGNHVVVRSLDAK